MSNGYLAKRAKREKLIIQWTKQVDQDALLMVFEDDGIPLEEAIKKVQKFTDYADEISIGLSTLPGASHKRWEADKRLENYCGELFAPWSERYVGYEDSGI